jgi:mRNA-degrading endonuclease RelE of RelBE toxin-antitoxin system
VIIKLSAEFAEDYARLSEQIQERVDTALSQLQANPRHPGLRVKKLKGRRDIWEARDTRDYRLTFDMTGELIYVRRVRPHHILDRP